MAEPYYAKKLLFNITKLDLANMDHVRAKLHLSMSDFIRAAIRSYAAEKRLEIFKGEHEG